uniref:Uncharacterized protein n=1 Tax=Physcomitrium patens TaxID=3218 RepID=A0A2K1JH42_PHYPA|nr:hypothetical protein PHYPA_018019 [Physcomitrium patens]
MGAMRFSSRFRCCAQWLLMDWMGFANERNDSRSLNCAVVQRTRMLQ